MKTKNIFSAAAVVLLAVFFASCSTSVDIAKRQFGNGYYVHVTSKKHVSSPANELAVVKETEVVAAKEVKEEKVVVQEEIIAPAIQEEKATERTEVVSSASTKKPVFTVKKKKEDVIASSEVITSADSKAEAPQYSPVQKKMHRKANRMFLRGDAPAIILILLCLFLPPLAVGIVDDWHTKFLFSILLTLCFWIPGVIYAFFVCFA